MAKLRKLWSALEAPGSVAGIRAELKQLLGDELAFAEPFLRRLPDPSETYPCPQLGWRGCPRRVITHPDGRIVAACGCDPPECETLSLRPQDVVRYELDVGLLCKFLGRALGFAVSATRLAGKRGVWNAGFLSSDGATRLPVFLVLPASRHELCGAMDHLLAGYEGAFIMLVPTLRFMEPVLEQRLRRRGARLVVLQDALLVGNGELRASESMGTSMGVATEPAVTPQLGVPAATVRVPRSAGSPQAVRAVLSYMQERGLGITQFANQVDTTDRTVRNFLKHGKMRRSSFETMATRMGLTTEQLLRGELPRKTP